MAIMRSIALSLLASALATLAVRLMLSVSHPIGRQREDVGKSSRPLVIVVPVLVGNSNNRIGLVRETHHHHHALLRWGGGK